MRFSSTIALALPVLATAQQSPLDQVKDLLLPYYEKFSQYIPNPNVFDAAEAAAARAAGKNVETLSLENWQSTLRPATGTEEWWVLITGGNKTCYGLCTQVEQAFNETALLFKAQPSAPHMALINCDKQPILCNTWSAGPPTVWVMEVPATGPVPIHRIKMNTTSTTVKTLQELHSSQSWKDTPLYDSYFHPFDGKVAELGLSVPLGYVLWVFAVIPSWAFMIGISFLSRTVM